MCALSVSFSQFGAVTVGDSRQSKQTEKTLGGLDVGDSKQQASKQTEKTLGGVKDCKL